jgi:hypothetical protein
VDSCAWKSPNYKREENSIGLRVTRVMDDCMPKRSYACRMERVVPADMTGARQGKMDQKKEVGSISIWLLIRTMFLLL